MSELTKRQTEVLTQIGHGYSIQNIAALFGRSVKTIESHVAEIKRRLEIYTTAGLVKYAIRKGLAKVDGESE